jgi:hypothetical protein
MTAKRKRFSHGAAKFIGECFVHNLLFPSLSAMLVETGVQKRRVDTGKIGDKYKRHRSRSVSPIAVTTDPMLKRRPKRCVV